MYWPPEAWRGILIVEKCQICVNKHHERSTPSPQPLGRRMNAGTCLNFVAIMRLLSSTVQTPANLSQSASYTRLDSHPPYLISPRSAAKLSQAGEQKFTVPNIL